MKKVLFMMAVVACVTISASADVSYWQANAAATPGNVVADGTERIFDGTGASGVAYNFGDLGGASGSTVEFIVNLTDTASTSSLGNLASDTADVIFKFEQYNQTGKLGFTSFGVFDKTLATDSPFDQDVHLTYVVDAGVLSLYVNGVFTETETTKTDWVINGGAGVLGAGLRNGNYIDAANGTIYAVGTYNLPLSAEQIAALYTAYTTASGNQAHTPIPTGDLVDSTAVTQLQWSPPENYTPEVGYDLVFRKATEAVEPNFLADDNIIEITDATATSPRAVTLEYDSTYYWRVDAYEPNGVASDVSDDIRHIGNVWSFTTAPETPSVTNPISVTEPLGQTATLTVTQARGTSYKWFKDGVEYSSDTLTADGDIVLTFNSLAIADEGFYHCEVYNSAALEGSGNEAVSEAARVMSERMVARWTLDGTLAAIEGNPAENWDGDLIDPNTANPNPDDSLIAYVPGVDGTTPGAADFDGELFVEIPDSNEFFNFHQQGFTLTAWVFHTPAEDYAGAYYRIIDKGDSFGVSQGPDGNYGVTGLLAGSSWRQIIRGNSGEGLEDEWRMIAITYDPNETGGPGTQVTYGIYDDDDIIDVLHQEVLQRTPNAGGVESILFGGRNTSIFKGYLDDIRIYNYALTADDIQQLYAAMTNNALCMDLDAESLVYDFNRNCVVDLADFATFAAEWLNSELNAAP